MPFDETRLVQSQRMNILKKLETAALIYRIFFESIFTKRIYYNGVETEDTVNTEFHNIKKIYLNITDRKILKDAYIIFNDNLLLSAFYQTYGWNYNGSSDRKICKIDDVKTIRYKSEDILFELRVNNIKDRNGKIKYHYREALFNFEFVKNSGSDIIVYSFNKEIKIKKNDIFLLYKSFGSIDESMVITNETIDMIDNNLIYSLHDVLGALITDRGFFKILT